MDGNDIEQIIKAKLDGTFTRVDIHGKVSTEAAPLDYIPDHQKKALPDNHGKRGPGVQRRHVWTPAEEIELTQLRRLGWSKMRCAHHFNCSEDSVRARLKMMREREKEATQ
jgi:hypothetical protein